MNFSDYQNQDDRPGERQREPADERTGWMDTHVNRLIDLGSIDTEAALGSRLRGATRFRCGQTLRFRLCDVYAPGLSDLFNQITPELELQGRISFLSDGGNMQNSYAVVEVPGILMPLIVPASCIETLPESSEVSNQPLATA